MSERPTKEQVDRALEEQRKMVWCGFDEPESWKGVLAAEVLALREDVARTPVIAQAAATLQRNVDTIAHNMVIEQRDKALATIARIEALVSGLDMEQLCDRLEPIIAYDIYRALKGTP